MKFNPDQLDQLVRVFAEAALEALTEGSLVEPLTNHDFGQRLVSSDKFEGHGTNEQFSTKTSRTARRGN